MIFLECLFIDIVNNDVKNEKLLHLFVQEIQGIHTAYIIQAKIIEIYILMHVYTAVERMTCQNMRRTIIIEWLFLRSSFLEYHIMTKTS